MTDADFRPLILVQLDAVFRLACHLTHGRQEAEDAVQETYLRALRSAHTFKIAEYGVRPWLFKILHNVICTSGAKSQRERTVIHDHANLSVAGTDGSDGGRHELAIDWDRVDGRLKVAIGELPLAYRTTFLLSAVEGLKYREIADVTDVPVGTVMSRLSRARVTLATQLAGLAAEQGLNRTTRTMEPETPPTP